MTDWSSLAAELDAWHADRRRATLWLRDDDLGLPEPHEGALRDWLELLASHAVPPCFAAVPQAVNTSHMRGLDAAPDAAIFIHGYAHANHAPADQRKVELGYRPLAVMVDELRRGQIRLAELFGPLALAVVVPPWNRIDDELVALLPATGFSGLSTLGPRTSATPCAGLRQINVHVDVIDWRGRSFRGEAASLSALVAQLRARRTAAADANEPTGILAHHRNHDADCTRFLKRLFTELNRHPATLWCAGRTLFATSRTEAAA